jgi:hypothetical protein
MPTRRQSWFGVAAILHKSAAAAFGSPFYFSASVQRKSEIWLSKLISFTSISFTRLVGILRRSDTMKSPLIVQNGNCVVGINRRRCFSLFSTIALPLGKTEFICLSHGFIVRVGAFVQEGANP